MYSTVYIAELLLYRIDNRFIETIVTEVSWQIQNIEKLSRISINYTRVGIRFTRQITHVLFSL